jgi:hypothetical protein
MSNIKGPQKVSIIVELSLKFSIIVGLSLKVLIIVDLA